MKYGFTDQQWETAKGEAKRVLIERAKVRGMIPYSELVRSIRAIALEPHDARLFHSLHELSTEENAAGRGMISALVVHKTGDMQPGPCFFELAGNLGKDTSDILRCWMDEVKKVHRSWPATQQRWVHAGRRARPHCSRGLGQGRAFSLHRGSAVEHDPVR